MTCCATSTPTSPISPSASAPAAGTTKLWRLGEHLAVRLPWGTPTAHALLRNEHTWVPLLAPRLPLPVPVPQRLGKPSERFHRPWIVTTWVPGTPADRAPATRPDDAADTLAGFLTALHRPAPAHAPTGRGRGGPLVEHSRGVTDRLAACVAAGLITDPDPAREVWDDAVTAPA